VAEEVVKFSAWLDSLEVAPTIAELTAKGETLRQAELARTMKDLGELLPAQAEAVDRLTRALVKKLLNHPILFLKEQSHGGAETQRAHTALMRRIFRLGSDTYDNED
jgi:glutamyl-tRNA reductase